jgi:hypothetical protein
MGELVRLGIHDRGADQMAALTSQTETGWGLLTIATIPITER